MSCLQRLSPPHSGLEWYRFAPALWQTQTSGASVLRVVSVGLIVVVSAIGSIVADSVSDTFDAGDGSISRLPHANTTNMQSSSNPVLSVIFFIIVDVHPNLRFNFLRLFFISLQRCDQGVGMLENVVDS